MRLVIFDAARKPSILDESWGIGAFSMWFRDRTDGMLGALSWGEVFAWLKNRAKIKLIKELQIWSHGSPGEVYINGEKLTNYLKENIKDFKSFMHPEGLIWFRTCATFHGKKGKEFAINMTNIFNCKIAAHSFKIGFPTHSGLHLLKPNEKPKWPDKEGINKNGELQRSYFWRNNTIMFWQNIIPKGW